MPHVTRFWLVTFLSAVVPAAAAPDLMPWPAKIAGREGGIGIDQTFRISTEGCSDPRVRAAGERLMARLSAKTGMPMPERLRAGTKPSFVIRCQNNAEDESYSLESSGSGIALDAPGPLGALHGMETFLQLVAPGPNGFGIPAVRIDDRPRFPWRGLLIDSARHFLPLEVIRRNIDAMAAVKFNVLHWHLIDDQGFRVESKVFPKLHELGSDGLYYTQQQIRDVIAYARDRGIRVVPEFEMPGHATALLTAYPELASAPGPYHIERGWGIFDPAMDPSREEVYQFLDRFLGEMSRLFPDPYIHIGGDEVNGKQWSASQRIQTFIRQKNWKGNHELHAYFNQRVLAILTRHGKKMMGWDEIFQPSLPKDIVVHSWRGQDSLADAARQGYTGILSYGYYLDHMQTAAFHYAVDPLDKKAASLTPEQKARILGGEACMWSEYVTPETIDSRIWPRAAVIAERLWSPQDVNDTGSMYRRMDAMSRELEWVGVHHRSNYRPMLERMAGANQETLRTLVDTLEPLKLYGRSAAGNYTSATPLNRVVDAARPESEAARLFPQDPVEQRRVLALWREVYRGLMPAIEESFLLREIEPVARDLSALGAAGLEALDYLERGIRPPESWIQDKQALLARAAKPRAEVSIAVVPALRQLIESASRLP